MSTGSGAGTIRRIAVFQALQLGDLLCATPALRALRGHYPDAEITLIGSAWARDMVDRLPTLDHYLPFPGYPGIAESPAAPVASPAWPPFDLAVQMHGAGSVSNGFVATLGAGTLLGHGDAGDDRLTLARPWQVLEPEPLRWLRLVALLGASEAGRHLEFPISPAERRRALEAIGGADRPPLVGVHVGASDPARRWPAEAFAAAIDTLAARHDCRFVLTGSSAERELTARVRVAARTPVIDLAGQTTLGEFAGVVAAVDLLLTNDTGASHVAAAVQTPSVVLFGPADPRRWAPLDAARHRVINARDFAPGPDGAAALQALPPQVVVEACCAALGSGAVPGHALVGEEQVA